MIPGGCTKYLQPLDLTVNRSFKSKLKQYYYKSMMDYTGKIDKSKKEAARGINMKVLLSNAMDAARAVSEQCILNGWKSMWSRK